MKFLNDLINKRSVAISFFFLFALLIADKNFSQTVVTDKTDYPPGDTVHITGGGWQPGESVKLQTVHQDVNGDNDTSAAHQPWLINADSSGNINSFWVVPTDEDELGATLKLTADGQSSLAHSETIFTDAVTQSTPQSLPYSADFSALPFSGSGSTTYPSGWQGWKLANSSGSAFRITDATGDEALISNGSASITSGGILNYNQKIGLLASSSTDPAICLSINATASSNIVLQFDIMTIRNPYDGSSNTRINQADVQFRIGGSGNFTSLSGAPNGIYQNNTTTQTGSGITIPQNSLFKSFALPPACNNQSNVQIRWVQRDASGSGSRPGFAIDNVMAFVCTAPTISGQGANATIECNATPNFTAPTASDGCGNVTINQLSDQTATGSCPVKYTRTITWDAIDANNNHSNTVNQTISFVDIQAPLIGNAGDNTTIECTASLSFTAPTASDACNTSTVLQVGLDVTSGNSCTKTITRTWLAVDACGNSSATRNQTITQVDTQEPTISNAGAAATIECTASLSFTAPTASDACNTSTVLQFGLDVTVGNSCTKAITRTWLAVDACGNSSATRNQTITQVDTQPPTIGAAGANATIVSTGTPVFTAPTASDACNGATVTLVSDNTVTGNCVNNFTRTKTWNAVDACGNTSLTRSQTITVVNIVPAVTNNNASQAVVYGSAITPVIVTANDPDSPGSDLVISTYYRKNGGNQVAGLPSALFLTQINEATHSRTWTVAGCMKEDVGNYQIKLVVSDECGGFDSTKFTIVVNNGFVLPVADAFYTGSCFYWTTGPNSSTSTLTLTASLKNVVNNCGDIRTAKVSFYVRNGTCPTATLTPIVGAQNLPVGLVNPGDLNVGAASAIVQYNIGSATALSLDIAVGISGNYSVNDCAFDKTIMIAVPVPGGQICGGGDLDNNCSAGYIAGAAGHLTNFSFFVKYNSSLKNPQGSVEMIIKSLNNSNGIPDGNLHDYRIKSNAISTLTVPAPNAQFAGKCNVAEIVNGAEVSIQGNCTMQLDMFDSMATSCSYHYPDKLALTVYRNNGGIWFSSRWIVANTEKKQLFDGNVAVSGIGTDCGGPTVTNCGSVTTTKTDWVETAKPAQVVSEVFDAKLIPNPTDHHFTLIIESNSTEAIEVKLFDIAGRQIAIMRKNMGEAISFGEDLKIGVYIAEVRQSDKRKTIKFIKQ
jgi:hypothetical protein